MDDLLARVAQRFERTAPTVETWADWLAAAKPDETTVADLLLLERLADELNPCLAANLLYHHQNRLGRDVSGQAGY